jgi:hypothetical protein
VNLPFAPAQKIPVLPGVHGAGGTLDVLEHISGQVDPHDPAIGPEIIVNPREQLPTGWGSENEQQFQSGHTNNLPTNRSAEQGYGVGPERRWAHYPHVEQPNPFRMLNAFQRSGGDSYSTLVYRPEVVAFWAQALDRELQTTQTRNVGPLAPVVNQAPSVPFVSTVPPTTPGGY